MQFPATSFWAAIAKGAARHLQWKAYVRKTTTISEALNSGTAFIEVTSRLESVSDVSTGIEIDVGQFTANSIAVVGKDSAWWKNNIFNAIATEYIEFKIELKIGLSETRLSSDTCFVFSGFADKLQYIVSENKDTIEFNVYSYDELGNRLIGENISTQYINSNVDGAGLDGLALPNIPGVYVTNANIASFVLKSGVHIITYEFNAGTERAKLDDGVFVTLPTSDGAATLQNADDSERVTVYVDVDGLYTGADARAEDVIVLTAATLPRNWFTGVSARILLEEIFKKIGINTVTYDSLEIGTWDGNKKVSLMDLPPNDPAIFGNRWALANDGTNLYMGIGNKLYRRNMALDTYTLIFDFGANQNISQIHHDPLNNDLWIVHGSNVDGSGGVRRYDVDGASMSSSVSIGAQPRRYCHTLFAWGSPSPAEIWFIYCDETNGDVRAVDSSLAEQVILSRSAMGYPSGQGAVNGFVFWRDFGTSATVYFQAFKGSSQWDLRSITMNIGTPGTWSDDGVVLVNVPPMDLGGTPDNYEIAAFNEDEDRIYFVDYVDSPHALKSHTLTSNTITSVVDLVSVENAIIYDGVGKLYTTDYDPAVTGTKALYEIDANVATIIDSDGDFGQESMQGVFSFRTALTFLNGVLHGIDHTNGNLWKYSNTLAVYIDRGDFEGTSVKESLTNILQAFNLITAVSPAKKAFVFRRGNDSGAIQTTGNILSVTPSKGSVLDRVYNFYPKIDYVEVGNGVETISYNGTQFDATTPADSRKLIIENELIPTNILKDLCFRIFQFWKINRNKIIVSVDTTEFQFEPTDRCDVSGFTEVPSVSGIILSANYQNNGKMIVEVLEPLS